MPTPRLMSCTTPLSGWFRPWKWWAAACATGQSSLLIPWRITPPVACMWLAARRSVRRRWIWKTAQWPWRVITKRFPAVAAVNAWAIRSTPPSGWRAKWPAWASRYVRVTLCSPAPWGRWWRLSQAIVSTRSSKALARYPRRFLSKKEVSHEQM